MAEIPKYDWSTYRKRRFQFVLGLIATFGVMISMGWAEQLLSFAPPLIFFGWLIVVIGPLAFRFALCPCPRCGKPVHFKGGFGYPFSPKCLNCGIKVGSQEAQQEK